MLNPTNSQNEKAKIDVSNLYEKVRLAEAAWAARYRSFKTWPVMNDTQAAGEDAIQTEETREVLATARRVWGEWERAKPGSEDEIKAAEAAEQVWGSPEMVMAFGEELSRKLQVAAATYMASYREAERTRVLAVEKCGVEWRGYAVSHLPEVQYWHDSLVYVKQIFLSTTDESKEWVVACTDAATAREAAYGYPQPQLESWGDTIKEIPKIRALIKAMKKTKAMVKKAKAKRLEPMASFAELLDDG